MPSRYQVTEPHPTVSSYTRTGRGGAGNTFKPSKTSNGPTAKGPASLFEPGLPATSGKFSAGRGGAGNIHQPSERAIFSFDEELEIQTTREQRSKQGSAFSTGRGGAGNHSVERRQSNSSGESVEKRPNLLSRLSSTFERR